MTKDEVVTVKVAIHKIQLSLLDGIRDEAQLHKAGLLLAQNDYHDVVTERTLAGMCGYPLCSNSLPTERPRKGRYRISRKEHKIYDLEETYMYCSSGCLINSRAFAASFPKERISTLDPAKLNHILEHFDGLKLDASLNMGKNENSGFSDLTIQEKTDNVAGEVSLKDWVGPSNAIDGYVPRRDVNLGTNLSKNSKIRGTQGETESKHRCPQPDILPYDINFTSAIITQDEYSISKTVSSVETSAASLANIQRESATKDKSVKLENFVNSQNDSTTVNKKHQQKESAAGGTVLKSSLKTSNSKKASCSVTWIDEKRNANRKNHRECREFEDEVRVVDAGEESHRFASADACAKALSDAAEAVASGKSDASNAVSEAGLTIFPPPHKLNESKSEENADVVDTDPIHLKWPLKPGFSSSDLFDSEESLIDTPPEEFKLTLSPFSTMFMAIFSWISSSSLAYIYGKEENLHEEYMSVNGREYPCKVSMPDGLSSEIKQTLAGCLSRALPGLLTELRVRIPVSVIEKGMGYLVNTMSFVDPLPAFRMKQWQVILLLFLDALSVSRIPALTPYILDRRILLPKVLDGAQISVEEYEVMKDLIIPLGRVPQLSTQSGG